MKYPKNRRSPVSHDVGGYTRKNGAKVSGYNRGHGTRPQKTKKTRVVGVRTVDTDKLYIHKDRDRILGKTTDDDTPIGVHAFTTNFTYSNKPDDGESVITISNNYPDAIDEAWEERMDSRIPIAVETIDPDIGAAIKWMGKRVKSAVEWGKPRVVKAAHLGAKYTVRATMIAKDTGVAITKAGVRGGVGVAKSSWSGAKELRRLTAFSIQTGVIENLLKLCYQEDRAKKIAARVALKKRYPEVYDMCDFSRESRVRTTRRKPKPRKKRRSKQVGQPGQVVVLPLRYKNP